MPTLAQSVELLLGKLRYGSSNLTCARNICRTFFFGFFFYYSNKILIIIYIKKKANKKTQELLDYLIKCYPVDTYNFDSSLLILVYIPPVIFHVKFFEQLEAHVLICAEVIINITKLSHRFTSLDSAVG